MDIGYAHLHGDQSVVDQNLFCQEVCANGGLVTSTELLVDLRVSQLSASLSLALVLRAHGRRWWGIRTYWFIKLVLPTPLSPRMITYSLSDCHATRDSRSSEEQTFRRTFLREDMMCDGTPGAKVVCLSSCFGARNGLWRVCAVEYQLSDREMKGGERFDGVLLFIRSSGHGGRGLKASMTRCRTGPSLPSAISLCYAYHPVRQFHHVSHPTSDLRTVSAA